MGKGFWREGGKPKCQFFLKCNFLFNTLGFRVSNSLYSKLWAPKVPRRFISACGSATLSWALKRLRWDRSEPIIGQNKLTWQIWSPQQHLPWQKKNSWIKICQNLGLPNMSFRSGLNSTWHQFKVLRFVFAL